MGNTFYARNIVASVLVMIWATRLAGELFHRANLHCHIHADINTTGFLLFRVLKTGSDTRFDEIRSHFFKFLGKYSPLYAELVLTPWSSFLGWSVQCFLSFLDLMVITTLLRTGQIVWVSEARLVPVSAS